jgi:hypothetical protein
VWRIEDLSIGHRWRSFERSSSRLEPGRDWTRPGRRYALGVRLAVGDAVVYPAYGVGRVTAREQRTLSGVEQDVVVIELAHGLVVTLSVAEARVRLRLVANEADVRRVYLTHTRHTLGIRLRQRDCGGISL